MDGFAAGAVELAMLWGINTRPSGALRRLESMLGDEGRIASGLFAVAVTSNRCLLRLQGSARTDGPSRLWLFQHFKSSLRCCSSSGARPLVQRRFGSVLTSAEYGVCFATCDCSDNFYTLPPNALLTFTSLPLLPLHRTSRLPPLASRPRRCAKSSTT